MNAPPADEARTPLARGVAINLAGLGTSLLLAVVAIPLIAAGLGTEPFGVLALAWSALGFVSLLNLGIGRALTQAVAQRATARRPILPLLWTAFVLLAVLGAMGGVVLALAAPHLAAALRLTELTGEARRAFRLIAVAVPFIVTGSAFISVLEARQRWAWLQLVAVPLSAVTYLGPLLALQFSDSIVPVIGILVLARMLAWCTHLLLVLHDEPALRAKPVITAGLLRPLLIFGGWTTVSQIASPLMLHADRYVIALAVSATAVAFYVTPQEIVLRLGMVSGAVIMVLFPAFAGSPTGVRSAALLERGTTAVFTLVFPAAFLLAAFAGELLGAWMGGEYAAEGAGVLRWLAVGLLINSLGKVPSAYLQGIGRPDLTARLHLVELPLYAGALWLFVARYGLAGAAAAWSLRMAVDTAALFWLCARLLPDARAAVWRAGVMAGGGVAALAAGAAVPNAPARIAVALIGTPLFLLFAWTRLLDAVGRQTLRAALRRSGPGHSTADVRSTSVPVSPRTDTRQ